MSINTDFQAEITRIFNKKSVSEISVDELNDLSARVFAETLGELDRLGGEMGKDKESGEEKQVHDIDDQIDVLMNKYLLCLEFLSDKIIQSITDKKSLNRWLEVVKLCDQNGNDFLGHALGNVLENPSLIQQIELKTIEGLSQQLLNEYFTTLQNNHEYVKRLGNLTENAVSPLLLCYFRAMGVKYMSNSESESYKKFDKGLIEKNMNVATRLPAEKNDLEKKPQSTTSKVLSKSKISNTDSYIKLKESLKKAKTYYRKRENEIKNLMKSKLNIIKEKKHMISSRISNPNKSEPDFNSSLNGSHKNKEFAKSNRKEYLARVSARLFKKKQEPKRPVEIHSKLNNNKKIR